MTLPNSCGATLRAAVGCSGLRTTNPPVGLHGVEEDFAGRVSRKLVPKRFNVAHDGCAQFVQQSLPVEPNEVGLPSRCFRHV